MKNGNGHDRDALEIWIDKHNHTFALVRTICNVVAMVVGLVTLALILAGHR